jgi:hypothetical protein
MVLGPVVKPKKKARWVGARGKRARRRTAAQKDALGRVHLALHRDAETGRERLALNGPVFAETWQNEVTAGTATTAREMLGGDASHASVLELARSVMAATTRLADGFLAHAPQGAVACKAGCDHCCYQSVGVTPPEALVIFDHLTSQLEEGALEAVKQRIAEARERTRGLSSTERFSPAYPCPFLEQGCCSIYEVRPLSCRGMNSLDADDCATRLREPLARAEFVKNGSGGSSFMEPIRGFHAVSAGLQIALSELYQLDMRPLDLTASLHLLLTDPESVVDAWLAGERAFEAVRGGDSSSDPSAGELSGKLAR